MIGSKGERGIGIALIALGVLLFLVFGLLRGSIADVGVYAISAVPIVIGIGLLWRASATNPG